MAHGAELGAAPESIFSADEQRRAHGGFVHNVFSTDWSADGRWVVYHRPEGDGGYDIWALSLEGERQLVPVTRSRSNEIQAEVSPDSRWVAYSSDESGRFESTFSPSRIPPRLSRRPFRLAVGCSRDGVRMVESSTTFGRTAP